MTNSPPEVSRALVCGHGSFAEGIVSAVDQITGRGDIFVAVTNFGLSGADLEARMAELVAINGVSVIFTDLPAGSATIAARRVQKSTPSIVVVTGTNLAALLDFVFHAEMEPVDAARQAVDRGRAAMTSTPGA